MAAGGEAHLYVYYRVVADTTAARDAIAQLIAAVESVTGVKGRLLARCEDASTWMEIYEPITDVESFLRTLAALVETHGVAAVAIDGRRKSECFAPLPLAAARS